MIKNPAQIRLLRSGVALCRFGGDSGENDSSTNTTNNTSNYVTSTDKRSVASDQAVSLTGDGNMIDRSTSSVTQMFDSSNRSTTSLTSFLDQSAHDSSTHFSDTSNRSTNFLDQSRKDSSTHFTDTSDHSVTNTMTDYGSVGSAMSLSGSMTGRAFDTADKAVGGAIDVLKMQTSEGQKTIAGAFDLAKSSAANAMQNSAQVLGFASSALNQTQAAYAEAKDGGQSKMMTYAILAAGAVGLAFAFKR